MDSLPQALVTRVAVGFEAQSAFSWGKSHWVKRLGHIEGATDLLKDLTPRIDRSAVADAVRSGVGGGNVVGAFCAVMAWGYGTDGRGRYRVTKMLQGEKAGGVDGVRERLAHGQRLAVADGAVPAFRYLNNEGHILHLGPAFFTKWLSFGTVVDDPYGAEVAPIFDKRVRVWLASHGISLRGDKTSGYESYVALLTDWGGATGWTAAQLESTIFALSVS